MKIYSFLWSKTLIFSRHISNVKTELAFQSLIPFINASEALFYFIHKVSINKNTDLLIPNLKNNTQKRKNYTVIDNFPL